MDLEIFDESYVQQAKLIIEIYKNNDNVIPNWWIEISGDENFEASDLLSLSSCFPAVQKQIENLVREVE